LWAILLLVAVAVAGVLELQSAATGQFVDAGPNPTVAPQSTGRGLARVSASTVLHARELSTILSRYAEVASAANLRRLRSEVDAACRVLTLLELDGRREMDHRREQARGELALRCAELPVPSMYVPVAETRLVTEDPTGPVAAASVLANLRSARYPDDLIDAWLEAYRQDALPQDQIFPDRRRLLPAEAEILIKVVIDWRECERMDACGADSLLALRVCALHGCAPGSDVQAAWHQALAPRDYESVQAIHQWLLEYQRGVGP
jgi:hypothetical protein